MGRGPRVGPMDEETFEARLDQATELMTEEPLRSFFLVCATGNVNEEGGEFDLEWEYAHDVGGEAAGERNALLLGAMVAAFADDGDYAIEEVTAAAEQSARAIAASAEEMGGGD